MQNTIEARVAKILEFEYASILIVEPGNEILYRFFGDHQHTSQGEIIMFPRNIGLTGMCIGSKEVIVNLEGKDNKGYRGDVDNVIAIE